MLPKSAIPKPCKGRYSEEIFFRVPAGQLKLRLAHPGKDIGTLISSSCQQINRQLAYKLNIWEVRISEVSTGSNQLRVCYPEEPEPRKMLNRNAELQNFGPFLENRNKIQPRETLIRPKADPRQDFGT
uniref:KH_dom_type_1 domain-containing protein n=1 Tax=Globodera pallida TaxID=36090 RepID=A0A183C9V5_GLOPA